METSHLKNDSDKNNLDSLEMEYNNCNDFKNQIDSESEAIEEVCRICHAGISSGSLYNPCKCTGSIRYIHQHCLLEWLKLKNYGSDTYCELCKHKFIFETLYSDDKPNDISLYSLIVWIFVKIINFLPILLRFVFVSFVWLIFIPVSIAHLFYFCVKPKLNFIENILHCLSNLIELNEDLILDIKVGGFISIMLFSIATLITLIKEAAINELDQLDVTVEINDIDTTLDLDTELHNQVLESSLPDLCDEELSEVSDTTTDNDNPESLDNDNTESLDIFYRRSSVLSEDFERTRRSASIYLDAPTSSTNLETDNFVEFKNTNSDSEEESDFSSHLNEDSFDCNIFNRRSIFLLILS